MTVVRDILCLVWGFGGIAIQQYTNQVSLPLLSVYVALLGVPGGFGVAHLIRGKLGTEPTPGSSSPSPPSASQPQLP